jgi:anti-sigma B factor antagonist
MKYTRTDRGDETELCIEGALDALSTPEIRPVIEDLVREKRPYVVIDASQLRLIDSSGVGAIVSLFKRIRAQGGDVKVVGLRDQPLAIFKLLRLDRIFAS